MAVIASSDSSKFKSKCGWLAAICLLLIIPVKAMRLLHQGPAVSLVSGIAPSLLGPGGFFLLFLSGQARPSRLSATRLAILVGALAVGLEFAQLIPRPGILSRVHYTFDWLDVFSSIVSIGLAYIFARKKGSMFKGSRVQRKGNTADS
jgi:hypothetical protein